MGAKLGLVHCPTQSRVYVLVKRELILKVENCDFLLFSQLGSLLPSYFYVALRVVLGAKPNYRKWL